ncbi:hypothetical protein BC938DRAFT_474028 [Jimgerdemannia flammicorona]|uniref:Uncharacterized protein n=1 Tax=Jimgerdemannia flammicorona TaxID=994334 RepID=A0A433QZQ9_9FUNG|nr:hypothetical protein BC938DRAFT_474028 [Jimgerdemannia flammicorona]
MCIGRPIRSSTAATLPSILSSVGSEDQRSVSSPTPAPTVVVPSDKQRQNYQGSLKRKRQPEEGPTDRDRPIRDPAPVPTEVSEVVPSDKQKHHRRTFLKPEGSKAESEPTDRGLIRSPIANFNPKKFARLLETR